MIIKKSFHSKVTFQNRYILICIIAILLVCGFGYNKFTKAQASVATIQQGLSDSLVRFHVVSAGDTDYEQALKLIVKNSVLEFLSEKLIGVSSKEETLLILEELTPEILSLSRNVLRENDCDMSVSASIEESFFPVKTYGDMTLPAGEYTALKIVIGDGEGTNWWCVLYPPLCFVDATYGVVPDKSKTELKTILAEDEYNAIFGEKVVFRFKFLKFLNKDFWK